VSESLWVLAEGAI